MAKISRLKVGQILWDKRRYKMGNTNMSTWGLWEVKVLEIDPEFRWVMASWNGNRTEKMFQRRIEKYKVKKPKMPESRW